MADSPATASRQQSNEDAAAEALQSRAEALKGLLSFAPRPFVIEFAGTPKSGKSTSVEAIRHFFNRAGFRVHVLRERAEVCPIPMKGHLFFNTWCAASMLAELLANVDTEADVIIIDRGIFDALVWLQMQEQRGELTGDEARAIEAFFLLDRWRTLVDLSVVMNVPAEEAMQRENSQRISRKTGSIMNTEVIGKISDAVSIAVEKYGPRFGGVVEHATMGNSVRMSNIDLASKILDRFEAFVDTEILVVPIGELRRASAKDGGAFSAAARAEILNCLAESGTVMRRSAAEKNRDYVQVISCGVLTYEDQVFVFERKERDPKYNLYGKATIWQGAHVLPRGGESEAIMRDAIMERISRSLFLSRSFAAEFRGYCWDPQNHERNPHFGAVFRVHIDNPHTATDLRKKEFRRGRGHGLAGKFVNWDELSGSAADASLEDWSQTILRERAEFLES